MNSKEEEVQFQPEESTKQEQQHLNELKKFFESFDYCDKDFPCARCHREIPGPSGISGTQANPLRGNDVQANDRLFDGTQLNGIQYNQIPFNKAQVNTIPYKEIPFNGFPVNGVLDNGMRFAVNGVQDNRIQFNTIEVNGVLYNGIQFNGIEVNGILYHDNEENGVQYNGIQFIGTQANGTQYNLIQFDDVEANDMRNNATGANGTHYNGLQFIGAQPNGILINGTDINGVQYNGIHQFNGSGANVTHQVNGINIIPLNGSQIFYNIYNVMRSVEPWRYLEADGYSFQTNDLPTAPVMTLFCTDEKCIARGYIYTQHYDRTFLHLMQDHNHEPDKSALFRHEFLQEAQMIIQDKLSDTAEEIFDIILIRKPHLGFNVSFQELAPVIDQLIRQNSG